MTVPGLNARVKKAYLLADEKRAALKSTATTGGTELTMPDKAPDAVASVVVLEIEAKGR